MTAQIPETLAGQITDEINRLLRTSEAFRDAGSAEVLKVLEEIEKLSRVNDVEALIRQASLAAITGSLAEIHSLYEKALERRNDGYLLNEFWVNFSNIGDYGKAAEIGTWLLDPKNGFFPSAWKLAFSIGQARAVASQAMRARSMFKSLADEDFTLVESAVKAMQETGLTDEAAVSVLALAGEVQRAHQIMFAGDGPVVTVLNPPEDDPPYVHYSIPVNVPTPELHEMNRDLGRLIVERLPAGKFPLGLVVSFKKAPIAQVRSAA